MTAIRLIAGLGNPGAEHEQDRHNAGFWFVDELARAHGADWAREAKLHGLTARARIGTDSVFLLQPMTWMNRSGLAVAALARFYRIEPAQILVVHDELDLLPGQAKFKQGGGHAGHNGLRDIQAQLGSTNFWRLRLGIGHPRSLGLAQEVVSFVLQRPGREQRQQIDEAMAHALDALPLLIGGDPEAAMQQLHSRN